MIDLKMLTTLEDLEEITGLPSDLLWGKGFNLDDWDVCFVSDIPLTYPQYTETKYDEDDGFFEEPIDEANWLIRRMECYCVGYEHVEYADKHYYMVYHS